MLRRVLAVTLLFAAQSAALAAPASQTAQTTIVVRHDGDVIIEFEPAALAAQSDLFDRLERDLAAMDPGIKTLGPPAPKLRHRYSRVFAGASARIDPSHLARVRALPYVKRVHPDREVKAFLAESVPQIGAPQVWESTGTRGAGVVVAIIDSGIDYDHPAFEGRYRGGRDFANDDKDPWDDNGHGTHVAGIVAANGWGLVGVAPDALLMAFKVLDESGSGRDSAVLAGIEEAAHQHVDVVNMSLGRQAVPNDPVIAAIEAASSQGIVFCVAAGNSGRFLDIGSPGSAPSAITVGAIDKKGRLAPFSTKGPVVPTGAIKPEVVAPGVDIVSARNGGGIRTASGTSMASPHVAGVAALLRAAHPEWTAKMVRSAIINGSRAMTNEVMAVGAGMVYAPDAVRSNVQPSSDTLSFGVADLLQPQSAITRTLRINNPASSAQTLSIAVEGLRDGIEVTPSASPITIAARGNTNIDVTLRVDHSKVPAPDRGSLSFGGLVRFSNDATATTMAIPWSFVEARRVRVKWSGSGTAEVRLATEHMTVSGIPSADGLFIGAGDVSLWVRGNGGNNGATYHILRDHLDLSATSDVTVAPSDAPHHIAFTGTDAQGRRLSDRRTRVTRDVLITHPLFDNSNLLDSLVYLADGEELYVSSLPATTKVHAFERAFDRDPEVSWSAAYPPLEGVDGGVDLTIPAGAWKRLKARTSAPPQLAYLEQSVYAAFWYTVGYQTIGSLTRPSSDAVPLVGSQVEAWMTSGTGSDASAGVLVEVGQEFTNPEFSAEFTATDEGVVPGHESAAGIASPVIASDEEIVLGGGAVFPTVTLSGFQNIFFANIEWTGTYGEQRLGDAARMRATLYDADGSALGPGDSFRIGPTLVYNTTLPSDGVYTFEAQAGNGTLRATFDSAKLDRTPPILTSLRIEDNRTLLFSAIDFGALGIADLARERTTVSVRRHGTDTWTTRTPLIDAEDFGSPGGPLPIFGFPAGVLYRADLGRIDGAVDVRLSVEDAEGNRTEYVLERAVTVSGRRRAAER